MAVNPDHETIARWREASAPKGERGIAFTAHSRAMIRLGHKGQTRRPMRHQPPREIARPALQIAADYSAARWWDSGPLAATASGTFGCPWRPGMRLYCREDVWIDPAPLEGIGCRRAFRLDGTVAFEDGRPDGRCTVTGHHDWWTPERRRECYDAGGSLQRRRARHMPRWAAALSIEISTVRAEPLQGITLADAIAEACYPAPGAGEPIGDALRCFVDAWEEHHARDGRRAGLAWADNPWVWVLGFTEVRP